MLKYLYMTFAFCKAKGKCKCEYNDNGKSEDGNIWGAFHSPIHTSNQPENKHRTRNTVMNTVPCESPTLYHE